MQEFSFLEAIEFDLESNPFAVRAKTEAIFNLPYKVIVDTRLDEYRNQLAATPSAVLQRTARIRASELSGHYAAAIRHEQTQGSKDAADRKRIAALCALSAGFIAASVVEYSDRGIKGFIEAFTPIFQQGDIERLAASAESQGITDATTFREQYIKAPASASSPKDTILHNAQALELLKKMQDAGMLDAQHQWRGGYTNYAKATFANYISIKAGIHNWDAAFTDLWGKKHETFSKAANALTNKSEKTKTKYQEMLSIFD